MINDEFLKEVSGKVVHVDFVNDKNMVDWIEGTLAYELDEELEEYFIEITSDTDYNRISENQIKKIYLKE